MDPSNGMEQLRVSDAEREVIVARLNTATGEGRLTLEEFGERSSLAYAARTAGELAVLVADLPAQGPGLPATSTPGPGPGLGVAHGAQVTPLGSIKRSGRWRLDRDTHLATVVGSVKLDLRGAEIAASQVELRVATVVGSVKVWIPRGIRVEVSGMSYVGSRQVAEESARDLPNAPLLRLHIDTVVGSVKVFRV
jgi:hypothetical protein